MRQKRILNVLKDKKSAKTTTVKNPPTGKLLLEKERMKIRITYPRRVHHRIIFSEVGKTILEAGTLEAAFNALLDVLIGMSYRQPTVPDN